MLMLSANIVTTQQAQHATADIQYNFTASNS